MKLSSIVDIFLGKNKDKSKSPLAPSPTVEVDSTTLPDSSNASGHQQLPLIPQPAIPPTAIIPTHEGVPSNPKPLTSDILKYPKLELPRPLFALLIGINRYKNHKPLNGAIEDVNSVADFLVRCVNVPERRITKLVNQAATADGIIKGILSLSYNQDIKTGDAILIYFAGHGARATAPPGWNTRDGKVEIICPVDMSTNGEGESGVSGIPDVVLNALITELADQKGRNITIILDCCHSANAMRGDGLTTRGIEKPPPVSLTWPDLLESDTRGPSKSVDLRSLDCAILLAACQRSQEAGENSQGGLFTQLLLKNISKMSSNQLNHLTYKDLIRPLVISDIQQPQCEGSRPYRYLFREQMASQSFISGHKDNEGKLILDAGEAHGIDIDIEFEIYSINLLSPDNPPHGRLIVTSTSPENATLSFMNETVFEVPTEFFAIHAGFPEDKKIKVYCPDSNQLHRIFEKRESEFGGFIALAKVHDEADLFVSFTDCPEERCQECSKGRHQVMILNWAEGKLIPLGSNTRIGQPIHLSELDKIAEIFRTAARFHYYLHYGENDPMDDGVEVALHLLQTKDVKIGRALVRKRTPVGKNLVEKGVAQVQLARNKTVGPYGLTLSNYTEGDLFPQVFWFECRYLSIEPWYTSQHRAGENGTTDAPLRACKGSEDPGIFDIGHGEVSHKAWGFSSDDQGEAVGFFKIFLATFNVNSEFMVQKSPFADLNSRIGKEYKEEAPRWWATQQVKVIQLAP